MADSKKYKVVFSENAMRGLVEGIMNDLIRNHGKTEEQVQQEEYREMETFLEWLVKSGKPLEVYDPSMFPCDKFHVVEFSGLKGYNWAFIAEYPAYRKLMETAYASTGDKYEPGKESYKAFVIKWQTVSKSKEDVIALTKYWLDRFFPNKFSKLNIVWGKKK